MRMYTFHFKLHIQNMFIEKNSIQFGFGGPNVVAGIFKCKNVDQSYSHFLNIMKLQINNLND